MVTPEITKIEKFHFAHQIQNMATDYNGFNQVYQKDSRLDITLKVDIALPDLHSLSLSDAAHGAISGLTTEHGRRALSLWRRYPIWLDEHRRPELPKSPAPAALPLAVRAAISKPRSPAPASYNWATPTNTKAR